MGLLSAFAIFFIIWWLVLFTVLPIGIRSQIEEGDTTLGTEHGAPTSPQIGRKMLLTTAISIAVFGVFYLVTVVFGFGVDSIPRLVPEF